METIISAVITCSGALFSAIITATATIIAARVKNRSISPDQPEPKPISFGSTDRRPNPPQAKRNQIAVGRILGTASLVVSIVFLCSLLITSANLGLPGPFGMMSGILGYILGILGFFTGIVALITGNKWVGIAGLFLGAAGFIITVVVIAIFAIVPFFQGGTFQR